MAAGIKASSDGLYGTLQVNSADIVTFNSSGNVGVGTSSPSAKLDVVNGSIRVNEDGAGTKVLTVRSNWAGVDPAINVTTTNALLLMTANTERMRVNAGAPILCLSGGNTSATGTGIAFPATQSASADANTLDDYEEGTFTPFYTPDGGAFTTLTYATQTGKYTKIGNFVFFSINIFTNVVTLGTASGGLAIGGLPFTSDATSQLEPGAALGRVYRWANAIPNIRCNINGNATTLRLPNMATNSTSGTNTQVSDLTTGSNSFYNCVDISGCYKIA